MEKYICIYILYIAFHENKYMYIYVYIYYILYIYIIYISGPIRQAGWMIWVGGVLIRQAFANSMTDVTSRYVARFAIAPKCL